MVTIALAKMWNRITEMRLNSSVFERTIQGRPKSTFLQSTHYSSPFAKKLQILLPIIYIFSGIRQENNEKSVFFL
jgi:hypothetical protein